MKIKDFIYCTPYNIKGIAPIKKGLNKFGVNEYFYLINNANLNDFKKSEFYRDFKEGSKYDLIWLLNRYAVCIVNKPYLLNKFLKKQVYELMNRESWTKTNVIIEL